MRNFTSSLRCTVAIAHADLLMRLRSPRFWIALGVLALATWSLFPGRDGWLAMAVVNSHYRGGYSSAWIGMVLALIDSTLLALAGFTVIRGTLVRDIDTRVWQLLVATDMTRRSYLFAKWCAHMIVLLLMALLSLAVGLVMQWLRAEDLRIDLIEATKPFLLIALPTLALTAAAAIWFDMLPPLRRTAGNILFFLAWVGAMAAGTLDRPAWQNPNSAAAFIHDPTGTTVFLRELTRNAAPQLPQKAVESFCLLCGGKAAQNTERFVWREWHPRAVDMMARAFWFAVALAAVAAAAPVLDWAASRAGSSIEASGKRIPRNRPLRLLTRALEPLQGSLLGRVVSAELLLTLRQRRLLWWFALLVLYVLQCTATMQIAAVAACLAWTLSLDALANAALRDEQAGTGELVFTAPGAVWRVLAARAIGLIAMTLAATLPAIVRFAFAAPQTALALIVIGISLSLWGMACGVLLRNARAYEIAFCLLLYHALNGGAVLNASVDPLHTALWHAALLPLPLLALLWRWPRMVHA
jgi:hypothetical protein